MKRKIIYISIIVIITLIISVAFFIKILEIDKPFKNDSIKDIPIGDITSNIIVNNNETIDVIDQIQINTSKFRTNTIYIPMTLYEENDTEKFFYTNVEEVEVYCDNRKLKLNYFQGTEYEKIVSTDISYGFIYGNIIIYNIPYRTS